MFADAPLEKRAGALTWGNVTPAPAHRIPLIVHNGRPSSAFISISVRPSRLDNRIKSFKAGVSPHPTCTQPGRPRRTASSSRLVGGPPVEAYSREPEIAYTDGIANGLILPRSAPARIRDPLTWMNSRTLVRTRSSLLNKDLATKNRVPEARRIFSPGRCSAGHFAP
jgi:hypothetical protein